MGRWAPQDRLVLGDLQGLRILYRLVVQMVHWVLEIRLVLWDLVVLVIPKSLEVLVVQRPLEVRPDL